jgi:hypothetical protein
VLTLEEQLLQRFFDASRLYDMAAVEKVATVAFNPRIDGVVEEFTVAGVEETGDRRVADVDVMVRRGGRLADERLRVTISRRGGRWLITDVRRLPASQTAPAASSAPPN